MKNEKGITLIKLCILIVIYLCIITVSIHFLKSSYKIANLENFVAKMELIQEKVNLVRNQYKLWENYDANEPGNYYSYLQYLKFPNANSSSNIYIENFNKIIFELNNSNINYWDSNTDSIISNYCYFNPSDLENYLGLEDIGLYVIINFYTGNVICRDGILDNGKIIYRQYDTQIGNHLVSAQINNNNILSKIEVIENNGLSQKVKIYLLLEDKKNIPNIKEIYYLDSQEDDVKKKCSNLQDYMYVDSEKAAYFTINTSGEYSFIIEDINYIQYPKVELEVNLCNSPILLDGMKGIYWDLDGNEIEIENEKDSNWYNYSSEDLKMANAKSEDGNYWVWLPRFIYKETKENIELDFVNGTSISSTRNKQTLGYKVHDAFENNGKLRGIWIAKFQANGEKENSVSIVPGKTLTVLNKKDAIFNLENGIYSSLKQFSKLMSDEERNAAIVFAKSESINISNDLIHYSGGAANQKGYINNTNYSSTNNVYGIYDLITSQSELTINSDDNEEGRYRPVILIKDL